MGEGDYDIRLDDRFGHQTLIDIDAEAAAHEPWFNQNHLGQRLGGAHRRRAAVDRGRVSGLDRLKQPVRCAQHLGHRVVAGGLVAAAALGDDVLGPRGHPA